MLVVIKSSECLNRRARDSRHSLSCYCSRAMGRINYQGRHGAQVRATRLPSRKREVPPDAFLSSYLFSWLHMYTATGRDDILLYILYWPHCYTRLVFAAQIRSPRCHLRLAHYHWQHPYMYWNVQHLTCTVPMKGNMNFPTTDFT